MNRQAHVLSPDVAGRAARSNSGELAFEGDRSGEWHLGRRIDVDDLDLDLGGPVNSVGERARASALPLM